MVQTDGLRWKGAALGHTKQVPRGGGPADPARLVIWTWFVAVMASRLLSSSVH